MTSFGGPVAHIGYFRDEYVTRRRWLGEEEFGEIVALAHLLPGPSSSQVGIVIGMYRAGKLGGLAAWLGFTLPSAVALTALALWARGADLENAGWVQGLELAAAAVVAAAVIGMRKALARGPARLALAAAAAAAALLVPGSPVQAATILVAGAIGGLVFRRPGSALPLTLRFPIGHRTAVTAAVAFCVLLVGLPVIADLGASHLIDLTEAFYRAGALVFGGGHVVLPLLDDAVVGTGWVSQQAFLAGYGVAQAVPGPLFTFSAYLGAIAEPSPNGVAGAAIALGAIFLPSFLLLGAVLPLWSAVRERVVVQAAVAGISAAVVGLLAAALWDPVLRTSVHGVEEALFAAALFGLLRIAPPWMVVAVAAVAGEALF
ncbi:MAG: chromate efflux transporter [Thermoleophilia bacterium]|nr:chromate efflux transporter [Thermoleophilia bacterium]